MTARTEDKDPLSDFYGVRLGGDGNSHDEENEEEEESITPIADEELRQYELGGNDHDDNKEEEKNQVSTHEDEELAKVKLTKEEIDFAISTMVKEAKYDELSIRQIIHGFNSTFTKLPIPHVINSKNSGAGKSYLVNHAASFYPEKHILILAGISDKALFHSDGPMVVENPDTGEVQPLDPMVDELEAQIDELKEADAKANKQQIKEIESEIKELKRSAQKLIDLTNKIIILQDTPQQSVFNLLMTLLSQDTPKDQIYAFTDKTSGSGKLIQSRNRIRGMPVLFTTQVIDDSDNQRFEEKNRRFIHVTPNTSREKIREANRLTAYKYGYLPDEYDQLVVNREDIAKTKQIIKVVVAKLKEHTKSLPPKHSGVKIPFATEILGSLPDDGRVWQMTVAERLMKYLSMNTKLHMDQRPRLVHKETGAFYPIATFEDLKDTLLLMERAASNMRPYLAEWYDRVFLEAFNELDGKPNEYQNDIGIVYEKENYVGLTTEQLAIKTKEVLGTHKPSSDEVRRNYLDPLTNLGLIEKVPSVRDNKRNIYFPTEYSPNNCSATKSNKILVTDPSLYPSRNLIEESFRTLVKYSGSDGIFFDQITDYRIEDIDGQRIELGQLLDRYFSRPEEYFEKGFDEEEKIN
jgi:hypothetical protein